MSRNEAHESLPCPTAKLSAQRNWKAHMLRPRWYKVIHDLFGNKTRTLLIVLSMAVGLFAIGIILSARSILSEGLAQSFAAIHPSSGTVRTIEPFDEDFLQSVRAMPEVQEAGPRRSGAERVAKYFPLCHLRLQRYPRQ